MMEWLNYISRKIAYTPGSRKLWGAVGGTVLINSIEGVNADYKLIAIGVLWVAYIIGTAIEDAGKGR